MAKPEIGKYLRRLASLERNGTGWNPAQIVSAEDLAALQEVVNLVGALSVTFHMARPLNAQGAAMHDEATAAMVKTLALLQNLQEQIETAGVPLWEVA